MKRKCFASFKTLGNCTTQFGFAPVRMPSDGIWETIFREVTVLLHNNRARDAGIF